MSGHSLVVGHVLAKDEVGVRFPLTAPIQNSKASKKPLSLLVVPIEELNWNGILRNIREIKDLLTVVLPEAGIIPDFSTLYA